MPGILPHEPVGWQKQMTPTSLKQAEEAARQAINKAPDSVFGHAALAWTLWLLDILYHKDGAVLEDAVAAADIAVDIDPRFFLGHAALGVNLLRQRDFDRASVSLRRSLDLNPSFPATYNQISSCLTYNGKPHEALDYFEPLDRISPNDPYVGYYHCVRAATYFSLGDDVAAIKTCTIFASRTSRLADERTAVGSCQPTLRQA